MSQRNDREYYAARATKARAMSEAAADRAIAAIHRRMAESYSELAELGPRERTTLRLVSR